jgi:hypothetical protein
LIELYTVYTLYGISPGGWSELYTEEMRK